jgi:hypothetical protein
MSDWSVRSGVAVSPSRNEGCEVRQQPPVGAGSGMVEFVDDDVVEVLRREPLQMFGLGQRLHRGAQHVDIGIAAAAGVVAHALLRQDADEGGRRLAQDLFAVRDEQDASRAHAHGVEGCQPGLAQAGGQHHQAAPVAAFAAGRQCRQRFVLDLRGLGRRLLLMAAGRDRSRGRKPPLLVGLDPGIGQRHGLRVAEQLVETMAGFEKAGIAGVDDPVVPLQPVLQRLPADVAGADERGSRREQLPAPAWRRCRP